MKRIKAACLEQTIHFMLREGYCNDMAKREVKQEVEKQYNSHVAGDYFE